MGMRNLILVLAFFLSLSLFGQNLRPLGKYNNIVSHNYYTLSYSEHHEQAEWVYYKINSSQLNSSIARSNNFRLDPLIKTSSAQLNDYKGSGYDRGHLAPAADMKYNSNSMSESFYMSNISPQTLGFNRGVWKKIEAQLRNWSYEYGELIIVTGPVLNGDYIETIGYNKVTVPKWYYKVAIDPDDYERNIAFLIENKSSSEELHSFLVSIDYLEEFSGLDFFHYLPNDLEESIESTIHHSLWNWDVSSSSKTNSSHVAPNLRSSSGKFFRSYSGKKYHIGSCRYLSKSKIPISLSNAKAMGLSQCGVCKP